MPKCNKDRKAKKRRRRDYEGSVQRKHAMIVRQLRVDLAYAYHRLKETEDEVKLISERFDALKAACDAILKHKLLIVMKDDRRDRRADVRVMYEQREESLPLRALFDYAYMYTGTTPPNIELPPTVRVRSFSASAASTIAYGGARSQDHMQHLIRKCLRELAEVITNMLFVKTMEGLR